MPVLLGAAARMHGWALKHVPKVLKTLELCFAAVERSGCALKYVPEELKTLELCLAAVEQDGWAFEHVPRRLKTPELCFAAVLHSSRALECLPEELKILEESNASSKTSAQWLVDTSDRGTIKIICYPPMNESEILFQVPNAVNATQMG